MHRDGHGYSEKDMTFSMVNKGFEKLSGLKRHEIVGKKKWMDFVAFPDLKKMMTYHENRRTVGMAECAPDEYGFLFQTVNKEERFILVHVGMIPGTDLPVILCSGYPGEVNEKKARDAGIRRFVMKPVTVAELSGTIQDVLKGDGHG